MVPPAANEDPFRTAFTVTVDLAHGVTTGISAEDRAATLRVLAHPWSRAGDFTRPGHIFPLRARPGGVLERPGHTEAAVDLARLAGRLPAGVLSEVVLDDGRMARLPDLRRFADTHRLPLVSIADLIAHRRTEDLVLAGLIDLQQQGLRLDLHTVHLVDRSRCRWTTRWCAWCRVWCSRCAGRVGMRRSPSTCRWRWRRCWPWVVS